MHGNIARLVQDKGFGFIKDEHGFDTFFHMSSLVNRTWETIDVGDPVEFDPVDRGRGPRAEDVLVL